MKKLPSVFANKISSDKDNNEKVYMSSNKEKKEIESKNNKPSKTINQKITAIMNSKNNSYKIPVKITTKEGTNIKNIIGKNSKNLITIENELIKIEDIIDIEKNE